MATGALQDNTKKAAIIFPDKASHQVKNATSDVAAMTTTPVHGTVTFFIKDPTTGEQLVSCEDLEKNQRSLDLTYWRRPLEEHGWYLVRPPRIRVFYANDVLYIGAEIPAHMMAMDEKDYADAVTHYTRTIAGLVFPDIAISQLPVNPHLRSRFPTVRGERGEVLSASHASKMQWGEGERAANIAVFNHGDSRYLPHYQTGSGFVTGFLANDAYADVYRHKTFHDLFDWASEHQHVSRHLSEEKIRTQYRRVVAQGGEDPTEEKMLQAFQSELFMALSRDIIDENKKKVGRYLNAIHTQALDGLAGYFDSVVSFYNRNNPNKLVGLTAEQFTGMDKRIVIMEMLRTNNVGFLREVLPQLLNKDFTGLSDDKILHIRDMHILDYENNLSNIDNVDYQNIGEMTAKCGEIIQGSVLERNLELSIGHFASWVHEFNKANGHNYQLDQFPVTSRGRFIPLMEMLNRDGENITFLRKMLPYMVDKDFSKQSDKAVFALRDQLVRGYLHRHGDLMSDLLLSKVESVPNNGIGSPNDRADRLLKLSILLAKGAVKGLAAELGFPLLDKVSDGQALFRTILAKISAQLQPENLKSSKKLLPQMQQILEMKPEELSTIISSIAEQFAANKDLHKRSAISFFTGKHSSTINQFVKEMRALSAEDLTAEQVKFRSVDLLQQFHDKLKAGDSKRTMKFFDKLMSEQFPPLRGVAGEQLGM